MERAGRVQSGRGCLGVACLIWAATALAGEPPGIVVDAAFDLRDASDPRLVSSEAALIKWESDGTMYWAPRDRNRLAVVVYRIDLPAPLKAIVWSDVRIAAYNANHESGQSYDPGCSAELDVSADGITWHPVQASFPGAPREDRDLCSVPELVDTRSLYLRAKLRTTKLHPRDRYRYAQFLRSHPDRDDLQRIRFVLHDTGAARKAQADDTAPNRRMGHDQPP